METIKKDEQKKHEIYSSFYLDNSEVAISVKAVQEVVNYPERIIPMPLAPDFLVGVFNLRGMIIPVINLKRLLKFEKFGIEPTHKIAIVEHAGARVGLIFDKTSEILRVKANEVNQFTYADERSHKVVSGAIKLENGNRIFQIIDPFMLVTIENIPQILDQQKNISTGKEHSKIQNRKKCISFTVNQMNMAFDISGIHEIVKVPKLQKAVSDNDSVMGVINVRGQVLPVINFAKLLKVNASESLESSEDSRIIILKLEKELFGLMVDSVDSIKSYAGEDIIGIPLLSKERAEMFIGCISFPHEAEIFILNHLTVLNNREVLEITQGHSKMYSTEHQHVETKKEKISKQSYISFRLEHLFGVSINDIKEIINYSDEVLQAPGLPKFVKGMLNLRGKLVMIIDTKALFKMKAKEELSPDAKILIFERGQDMFGLIVDSVESILTVDTEKNLRMPDLLVQQVKDQFQNDIKEIIAVPNGDKKDVAMIILNMEPVTTRIKNLAAA